MNALLSKVGIIVLMLCVMSCREKSNTMPTLRSADGRIWHGVPWTIQWHESAMGKNIAAKEIIAKLERDIHESANIWNSASFVSRFNMMPPKPSTMMGPVPDCVVAMLHKGEQLRIATGGAYDVNMGLLRRLRLLIKQEVSPWFPSMDDCMNAYIAYAREGPCEIREELSIEKKRWIMLDLQSLTEGWVIDNIAAYLQEEQCFDFLIALGGEFYGRSSNRQTWNIQLLGTTEVARLHNEALGAASVDGDDRSLFPHLDARTGGKLKHSVRSVWVRHPKALEADGWATALLVLGQEGVATAQKHEIAACFLLENGMILKSPPWISAEQRE